MRVAVSFTALLWAVIGIGLLLAVLTTGFPATTYCEPTKVKGAQLCETIYGFAVEQWPSGRKSHWDGRP